MHAHSRRFPALAATAALAFLLITPLRAAPELERLADGIIVPVGDTFLRIELRADNIVRVACAKDRRFFVNDSLALLPAGRPATTWELTTTAGTATLSTAQLKVQVDLATGAITFLDSAGQPILAEKKGGREITAAAVQGEPTYHVRQTWEPNADEALYGLGENQLGLVDLKGYDLDLWQHNGTVVVPFLVSSRG